MSNTVYQINKGINRPIEFKGLKAQYIWWLGAGLVILLLIFAILYICGVSIFICLAIIGSSGTFLFVRVYRLSHTHGEYGLMKKLAKKSIPKGLKNYSTQLLKKQLRNEKYN